MDSATGTRMATIAFDKALNTNLRTLLREEMDEFLNIRGKQITGV